MNKLLLSTIILGLASALLAYGGRTGGPLASPVVTGAVIVVILAATVTFGILVREAP